MEIRQLRYFVTVAQTLNFSEAARRLYVTQGTLSQQIQQLEFELGSVLFDRSSHSVSLTEAGEELLPLALDTINASEACRTRMNDLKGVVSGKLRVGCARTFRGMMTSALRQFMKENPGVDLNIQFATEEELLPMLRNKEIDMALSYKSIQDTDDVDSEVLFKTSLHVLMRKWHPLAGEKQLTLEQLAPHGIIIPGKSMFARQSFDRFVGIDTQKLNIKLETNDPEMAMSMVMNSNLFAISTPLPATGIDGIVSVPLENNRYTMCCCLHRLKNVYHKKSAEILYRILRDDAKLESHFHIK